MTEPLLDVPPVRLPDPCLVVLVGATASGKSHVGERWFHPDQIVSSDRLRAVVGTGERDQRASRDAFELLDLIVAKRLRARADDGGRHDRPRGQAPRGAGARWPSATACPPTPSCSTRPRPSARAATARAATPVPAEGRRRAAARGRRRRRARSPTRASRASTAPGPVELVPPALPDAPDAAAPPEGGSRAARVRPADLALRLARGARDDGGDARRRRARGRGAPASRACG